MDPVILNGIDLFTFDRIVAYIGIGFTVIIAFAVYRLQNKTSELHHDLLEEIRTMTGRIDSFTQQKATAEQTKKEFQCRRIIDILEKIKTKEEELRRSLINYSLEDPTNELLKFSISENLGPNLTSYRIKEILDACRQLEGYISDSSLLLDIRGFSDALMLPAELILNSNKPQNKQDIDSLLFLLNNQLGFIEEYLVKFHKELNPT